MPGLISPGPKVESSGNVNNPTDLVVSLPPVISGGDWLLCYSASTSTTATVGISAGWALVYSVLGAAGRLVMFARKADGTDTAPTVTWTGVTTGNSGTPSLARIHNWGVGFAESAGALVVDVLGTVSEQAASLTVMAGGAGITTTADQSVVFAHAIRLDDALTALSDVGTGLSWTGSIADDSISGTDCSTFVSWGITDAPGQVIGTHTWSISGTAQSVISSGVMVALALAPLGEPDVFKYTRGRR